MSSESAPRGGWNVALIISLCLNCLLAGVIVMAVLRFTMIRPLFAPEAPAVPPGAGMGRGLWQMQPLSPHTMIGVAPGKTGQIRAILDAHREQVHALRQSSFEARRETWRLFSAPDFDQAAFDKSLAKLQSADAALETEILKVVSESAATLSPEERRAMADAPAEWGRGRGHGHGHGRGHGWRRGGGPGPMPEEGP